MRLLTGDTTGYRKLCVGMLKRFGATQNTNAANYVVWTCALAPEAVGDLTPVVQLAEKNATQNPKSWHAFTSLGGAYYRAGRFDAAIENMSKACSLHPAGGNAFNWLFIAMAHHQLGRTNEARVELAKAIQWIEEAEKRNVNDPYIISPLPWRYSLQLVILRRESEALVSPPRDE